MEHQPLREGRLQSLLSARPLARDMTNGVKLLLRLAVFSKHAVGVVLLSLLAVFAQPRGIAVCNVFSRAMLSYTTFLSP